MSSSLQTLVNDIRQCKLCQTQFSHAPNPIIQVSDTAKVLIIGQAPGVKAHQSNTPWNDDSGDKLRRWLGVNKPQFYNDALFAHLPMAFCFPGYKHNADAPPPKICAQTWHNNVLRQLSPTLTLYIGRYSQQRYLPMFKSVTQAVRGTTHTAGHCHALPHPSGRNNRWLAQHPWFEKHAILTIQQSVKSALR